MSETGSRNSATHKQAKTWLTPDQIERIRDACLSETFFRDTKQDLVWVTASSGMQQVPVTLAPADAGLQPPQARCYIQRPWHTPRASDLTSQRYQAILPRERSKLLSWALNSPTRSTDELMHQIEGMFV